ncbi:MAG: hypothetical protein V1754_07515 [Pseudomonadota bacterium]
MFCPRRALFLLAAGLILAFTIPAVAGKGNPVCTRDSRLMRVARAYLAQTGLSGRYVKAGPTQRRVNRLIVPVTPQTAERFAQTFSAGNGFVRFRESRRELGTFMMLSLEPDHVWHNWFDEVSQEQLLFDCPIKTRESTYKARSQLAMISRTNIEYFDRAPAVAIPVDLKRKGLPYLEKWLRGTASGGRGPDWSNCMHLTTNAQIGPKRLLWDFLGIRRSFDGPNMWAKMMHAANDRVEVVARYVQDQAAFDALPRNYLLGPIPVGGVEAAAKGL